MIKINETITIKGRNYQRVSITKINNYVIEKSLFYKKDPKNPIKIYVIPSKANPWSPWINGLIELIIECPTKLENRIEEIKLLFNREV